MLTETDYD